MKKNIKLTDLKKLIRENSDVFKQRVKNKLKQDYKMSDSDASKLIKSREKDLDDSYNNKENENKATVKLMQKKDDGITEQKKGKITESSGKLTMNQFANWLGLDKEAIILAKQIVEVSDSDGAYTHLQDMGEDEAAEAVEAIYFEYGSFKEAVAACREDLGINESGGHANIGSSIAFSDHKSTQRSRKEGEVELSTLETGDIFITSDGHSIEFRVWGKDPNGGIEVQYSDSKFDKPNYSMRPDVMVFKK